MTMRQLREIAKIYHCAVRTTTRHHIQSVIFSDPSFEDKATLSPAEVDEMTQTECVTIFERISGKKTADLWTRKSNE